MPEAPAPTVTPWPRAAAVFLLGVIVVANLALWSIGFYALFSEDLPNAGIFLTLAVVVFLLGGWAWRWFVAMGKIGGRPTVRFGGASKD